MSDTALLVIDMLNDYRHADAEQLAASVATIVEPLVSLIARAGEREDIDLIYVNDNRGGLHRGHGAIIETACRGNRPDLVEPLIPAPGCRMLTKVRHSVFYATALDYLLGQLQTRTLVLTGQVTEQCILFGALDGYIRHYDDETVVQYGVRTPESKTILVLTESRAEAERALDMFGKGALIERTVRYGRWRTVDEDLSAAV